MRYQCQSHWHPSRSFWPPDQKLLQLTIDSLRVAFMWLLRRTAASPGFGLRQPEKEQMCNLANWLTPPLNNLNIISAKTHMQSSYLWVLTTFLTYLRLTPGEEDKLIDSTKGWVSELKCHQIPNSDCILKIHLAMTLLLRVHFHQ